MMASAVGGGHWRERKDNRAVGLVPQSGGSKGINTSIRTSNQHKKETIWFAKGFLSRKTPAVGGGHRRERKAAVGLVPQSGGSKGTNESIKTGASAVGGGHGTASATAAVRLVPQSGGSKGNNKSISTSNRHEKERFTLDHTKMMNITSEKTMTTMTTETIRTTSHVHQTTRPSTMITEQTKTTMTTMSGEYCATTSTTADPAGGGVQTLQPTIRDTNTWLDDGDGLSDDEDADKIFQETSWELMHAPFEKSFSFAAQIETQIEAEAKRLTLLDAEIQAHKEASSAGVEITLEMQGERDTLAFNVKLLKELYGRSLPTSYKRSTDSVQTLPSNTRESASRKPRKHRRAKKVDSNLPSHALVDEVTKLYERFGVEKVGARHAHIFRRPLQTVLQDRKLCEWVRRNSRGLDKLYPHNWIDQWKKPSPEYPPPTVRIYSFYYEYQDPFSGQQWRLQQTQRQQARHSDFKMTTWHAEPVKQVAFTWTETIYHEDGSSQIVYRQSAASPRTTYLKETRFGSMMLPEQLESTKRFKAARADFYRHLQSAEMERQRQMARSRMPSKPRPSQPPKATPTKPPEPTPQSHKQSAPQDPSLTICMKPSKHKHPRPEPPRTKRHHRNHISRIHVTQTLHNMHLSTFMNNPPHLTSDIWKYHVTRIWEPLSSPSSYFLPLLWQHHAWIAPAHRKTLRQQPFLP
jgi:hypothetical protein